jgi:hypothetical protein
MIQYLGLWILILMTLNMWALLSVLGSGASIVKRALWAAILIAFPGLGYLGWYLIGPRRRAA